MTANPNEQETDLKSMNLKFRATSKAQDKKELNRSDSVNLLLNRLNNLNHHGKKSKFEDESYEDHLQEDGNRRLDLMRLPQFKNNNENTENFRTVRPAGREISQYSQEMNISTPGGQFKTLKHINFSQLWNRLLKDEKKNKPQMNYFTTKPPLQPVRQLSNYQNLNHLGTDPKNERNFS